MISFTSKRFIFNKCAKSQVIKKCLMVFSFTLWAHNFRTPNILLLLLPLPSPPYPSLSPLLLSPPVFSSSTVQLYVRRPWPPSRYNSKFLNQMTFFSNDAPWFFADPLDIIEISALSKISFLIFQLQDLSIWDAKGLLVYTPKDYSHHLSFGVS